MKPPRAWTPLMLVTLLAADVEAQRTEVVLEVGASQLRPPVEVDAAAARFLVAGVRAARTGPDGSGVWGAALAGRATDAAHGADFLSGDLGGAAWRRISDRVSVGAEARAFAFEVANPWPYRAGGLEGSAGLRFGGGAASGRLGATAGLGRSRAELRRYVDGPARVLTDDLWRWGGEAEVLVGGRSVAAGVAGALQRTAGGTFGSLGGRLVVAAGASALELRLDAWDTPSGTETTGGLSVVIPVGRWVARGFAGRAAPDPLTLAEPGRAGGGMLVGYRVAGHEPAVRTTDLFELGDVGPDGTAVRFRLEAPGATRVAVLGDFTLWDAVPLERNGDAWSVTVTVPPGVHHFGFLVDGAWHVPDDAPDRIPDEWGRTNATLVVEQMGPGHDAGTRGVVR